MSPDYVFETDSDLGGEHVGSLEAVLDRTTTDFLTRIGVQPGQRCLDLGAGGGSITRWLADRVGPSGSVVSVDLETERLQPGPRIQVYAHDITDGLPVEGPFDLIHARLLLMHLPQREEVLERLVQALAPGGWLVLGDFGNRPLQVVSAPSAGDAEIFERIHHRGFNAVAPAVGMSFAWAHQAPRQMLDAGLASIRAEQFSCITEGGSAGCRLHRNLTLQAAPLQRRAGTTAEELERYRELMGDPRFRAWFYEFNSVAGQKPAA